MDRVQVRGQQPPRPPLAPGDEISLRVDRLSYGGRGVGRHEGGMVVFAAGAAPAEQARVRIHRVARRFAEGEITAVEEASPERIVPRCPHFGPCGGCAWQHVSYEAQVRAKEEIVRDSLRHLGGFVDVPLRPVLTPPSPWYYRNKMEFTFHPDGTLGLHRRGAWDRIVRLETCFLQSPRAVEILLAARAFAEEHTLPCYHPRTREGFLRQLVIREGKRTGEIMVGLITAPGAFPQGEAFAERVGAVDPAVVSILRGINAAPSDGGPLQGVHVLGGRPHIFEQIGDLTFRIGLETFFQTNTLQAERLVDVVRELAAPGADGPIIDLYCGVGTFALALAGTATHVAGIEVVASSVEAARENAALNGLANVAFHLGDARTALPGVVERIGRPRVLVLDPPRAGAGAKVMRKVGRAGADRIIYVSCNPTTLAPDLRELQPFGYRIAVVQPLDLFPQTYHVETVVAADRAEPRPPPGRG